jgi:hypothetical protein
MPASQSCSSVFRPKETAFSARVSSGQGSTWVATPPCRFLTVFKVFDRHGRLSLGSTSEAVPERDAIYAPRRRVQWRMK